MYQGIISRLRATGERGYILGSSLFTASSRCGMADCTTNRQALAVTLESLRFDNVALRELPVDESRDISQRQVRGACFSRVLTTPVQNPKTVLYSADAMHLLGLLESELNRPEFAEHFSGNRQLPGSEYAAHCYCGHQFGYFAGQLGDGAAMYV